MGSKNQRDKLQLKKYEGNCKKKINFY
ncbi:MAG: 50S ribosomal protein L33 [Succinivibrio sp.]|nr:50S ribosomal protein L33 [Succinivibrio sp.]